MNQGADLLTGQFISKGGASSLTGAVGFVWLAVAESKDALRQGFTEGFGPTTMVQICGRDNSGCHSEPVSAVLTHCLWIFLIGIVLAAYGIWDLIQCRHQRLSWKRMSAAISQASHRPFL